MAGSISGSKHSAPAHIPTSATPPTNDSTDTNKQQPQKRKSQTDSPEWTDPTTYPLNKKIKKKKSARLSEDPVTEHIPAPVPLSLLGPDPPPRQRRPDPGLDWNNDHHFASRLAPRFDPPDFAFLPWDDEETQRLVPQVSNALQKLFHHFPHSPQQLKTYYEQLEADRRDENRRLRLIKLDEENSYAKTNKSLEELQAQVDQELPIIRPSNWEAEQELQRVLRERVIRDVQRDEDGLRKPEPRQPRTFHPTKVDVNLLLTGAPPLHRKSSDLRSRHPTPLDQSIYERAQKMYHAHRGMLNAGAMQNTRLTELFEQIKNEFEAQGQRVSSDTHERDAFLNQAIEEMSRISDRARQIEEQAIRQRQDYDDRVRQMQHQMDTMPRQQGHPGQHHHQGAPLPPPPSIGHGPRDLFGQIMQGGQGQNAGLGAPPPQPEQPQGLPPHLTQGAAMNTAPPQAQFAGYHPGPGPSMNGYPGGGPPPIAASPGPGRGRQPRGPPGPGTPAQQPPQPYPPGPPSPRGHIPTPPMGHRAPPPGLPPHQQPGPPPQHYMPQLPDVGNDLYKLHEERLLPHVPANFKKEFNGPGDETWWAMFNPRIPRELDIELVQTLVHTSVVCCVRFSRDGRYIATGCNRIAQIFDAETGVVVASLEDSTAEAGGDLYIRSVCFSPDGRLLATGAEDRLIRVWDIEKKVITAILTGHAQDIYSLDFAIDGRTIASGSGDKTVRLWDVETQKQRASLLLEDGVTTVALSADGRYVAAGSLDTTVRVYDVETALPLYRLGEPTGHKDSVYSVAFSPTKNELVSGSLDKTIKLWQLEPTGPEEKNAGHPGRMLHTFEGHADYVLSVGLTSNAKWVFSGSKDRGVQFWDPETGHAHMHLCGHRNSVISVAPSPKPELFATGSGDQKAKIWRIKEYRG